MSHEFTDGTYIGQNDKDGNVFLVYKVIDQGKVLTSMTWNNKHRAKMHVTLHIIGSLRRELDNGMASILYGQKSD